MPDHIHDAASDRGRETLASFSYPWAAAPDIIRSHQKDAYFQSHLVLQLSTIIRSLYGARAAHTWDNEARTFAELLYLGLTTFVGNRTLGEEYTDIVQVDDTSHRLPALPQRTAYILSSILLPYTLTRLLPNLRRRLRAKLESTLRKAHTLRTFPSPFTTLQDYTLRHLDTLTSPSLLYALSLATFYFTGAYYQLSKRLFHLRYVFTRKVEPSDQRVGYEVLGVLLVLQLAVQAYTHAQDTYRTIQTASQPPVNTTATGSSSPENPPEAPLPNTPLLFPTSSPSDPAAHRAHLSSITSTTFTAGPRLDLADNETLQWISGSQRRKCTLCLEALKDPSATTCGHVFCWACVTDWLKEQPMCPLCRQSALVQHVLPLQG